MLDNVQVLTENGHANIAVILFAAFEELRALLASEEKLAGCLDYLHTQKIKEQQPTRLKLAEVKAAHALNWHVRQARKQGGRTLDGTNAPDLTAQRPCTAAQQRVCSPSGRSIPPNQTAKSVASSHPVSCYRFVTTR